MSLLLKVLITSAEWKLNQPNNNTQLTWFQFWMIDLHSLLFKCIIFVLISVFSWSLLWGGGKGLASGVLGVQLQASSVHIDYFEASGVCVNNDVWSLKRPFSGVQCPQSNFLLRLLASIAFSRPASQLFYRLSIRIIYMPQIKRRWRIPVVCRVRVSPVSPAGFLFYSRALCCVLYVHHKL